MVNKDEVGNAYDGVMGFHYNRISIYKIALGNLQAFVYLLFVGT